MATKFSNHTGTIKWAKVYKGQEDPLYKNYSIDFYPDDVEALLATGLQVQPRKDKETGEVYFKLRRDVSKLINGKVVEFGPPDVWDSEAKPFDKSIGNGSKVTIRLAVYDTATKGKGHRLEAVMVNEWVEYKRPDGEEDGPRTPKFPF